MAGLKYELHPSPKVMKTLYTVTHGVWGGAAYDQQTHGKSMIQNSCGYLIRRFYYYPIVLIYCIPRSA